MKTNDPIKRKVILLPKKQIILPTNKQLILLPKKQIILPKQHIKKDVKVEDNLLGVGQMAIKWVGSDQYAATISQIGPEKGIIYLTQYRHSDIRAKKNTEDYLLGIQ